MVPLSLIHIWAEAEFCIALVSDKEGEPDLDYYLLAGVGIVGQPGAKNVYGLVLQPVYRISPHLEGVFQYQMCIRDSVIGNAGSRLTAYAGPLNFPELIINSFDSFVVLCLRLTLAVFLAAAPPGDEMSRLAS